MTSKENPKTIVVTGASAGIGEAVAFAFAKQGWNLVLGARRVDKMTTNSAKLMNAGAAGVTALTLDVTDAESVATFAREALKAAHQRIDVLVNNAGLALGVDKVADGKDAEWATMLDTNVMGLLRTTRALLPAMISANHGHIINMGSIASHVVYEGGSVYCATKHAVRAITKTMRLELNGTAIRVSLIDPGMVETDFSKVRLGDDERAKNVYRGVTPLTGDDIAECVLWSALRPAHVNIEEIVVMPVDQAAPHKLNRKP